MAVYNSIQLDLCKKNSYKAIPTKQLDINSRFLRVELLNNGSQYDFNDGVTVMLASTRNGETKAYKCTVEDSCVVAPLTSWMLAEEGYVDCEIVLIDTASNSKLSSFAFSICVDESIYNDETISQDENYSVLLQLITDVDTVIKSCNTATEKATEIYNTVETKLNNGELKGEKGDKGDKGDRGEQGIKGEKGDTGESGLIELKANTLERWIKDLTNHLYYTVDDVRLRTHNTQKIYLDLPQGTFLLVEKETDNYGNIDLKITIWGSCTFDNIEYKYGIHQYKYNTLGGAIINSFIIDTKSIEIAIANLEANKQDNLTAGAGITITDNGVISSDVGLKTVVLKDDEDLPNEGVPQKNTIYFKRNTETDNESTDWYEEYIWVNNWWELIGTTKVDLSAYAKKSEVPTKTSELENDSNFVSDVKYNHTDENFTAAEKKKLGTLVNYNDTELKNQITKKQDKLSKEQLENISAVPNKIDQSQVGNGLKFADGQLQLNISVASVSTTYGGGDAQ